MHALTSLPVLVTLSAAVLGLPQPQDGGPATAFTSSEGVSYATGMSAGPQYMTMTIINSHTTAITTSYVQGTPGPSPFTGDTGTGTMSQGQTAAIAVPTGWAGNVAFAEAGNQLGSNDSLLEASYVISQGYEVAVADVDVSNVNGFTIAASCSCAGVVVAGCNLDLNSLNACPDGDLFEGACVNPTRFPGDATAPTPFFAPCAGMSYSYPNDNAANSWGACQDGTITCCVGTACPPHPNQNTIAANNTRATGGNADVAVVAVLLKRRGASVAGGAPWPQ